MKLKEAIATTRLSVGHLVSGRDALEQDVSWVQIIDHPDIEPWVDHGHLLLTTGYNWPKDEVGAANIIRALHKKGLSGVVLAVPQFLEHFPSASIDVARDLNFPLIELPWEVPFSEVTQSIHREIVDHQAQLIVRSEHIHNELTNAALGGLGLQDLAETLGELIKRPVFFCDMDGRTLGQYLVAGGISEETPDPSQRKSEDLNPGKQLLDNLEKIGLLRRIAESKHPVSIPHVLELNDTPRVSYPIRIRGELLGIAWINETDSPLGELDLRAVEHAGTVASLMLSHQRDLSAQEARMGYTFVDSLLEGQFESTPSTLERANLLGWDPDEDYRVCAFLLNEPIPLSREGFFRRERLAEALKKALSKTKTPALLSMSLNQIHLLLPAKIEPESIWAEVGSRGATMAISRIMAGVAGMRRAAEDVAILLPILKPGKIHYFDEMLLPLVLQGDVQARKLFLQKTLDPLKQLRHFDVSMDTLTVLTEEGFHLANTAKRLGLHISSLRYRVERMQEVMNVSFEDVEARFRLQLAIKLYTASSDESAAG
ncbi:PucR family transcriptional regulator [Undibacterium terreum]|uniref:Transcriptional regulator n=1 Tax=Undibacterium terreum TaxID=1224302 RepID=A0A916UJV1_9BURK|nr:PucR family transcriptional regulator [Undibacterium terreum]GGC75634.1 transcriptional regulator [Undibacterium terreum]